MNKIICGNTQAEIDRDTDTAHAEQTRFIAEEARWIRVVNELLAGKIVNENGYSVTLEERMIDQYQEFADLADLGHDFMADFLTGTCDPEINKLFDQEARALASIVVG